MMKRIALLLILFSLAFNVMADGAWTVRTVPNTRLQSNDIHVSDPDGYLSDSAEMAINTALCAIRDKADVFVVTLSSIGEAEPKHFATELFNDWGIGDAETDNGVLLLFVEDQHALEFETGYGAEETLTDSKCERIFTKNIKPFFKAGDYEGGFCSGVAAIVDVYGGTVPDGLKTFLPEYGGGESDDDDDFSFFFSVFCLFAICMPIMGFVYWMSKVKTKVVDVKSDAFAGTVEDGVTYFNSKSPWSGSPWEGRGCLGAMLMGLSLIWITTAVYILFKYFFPEMETRTRYNWTALVSLLVYFTWICFRHNHRALKIAKKVAEHSLMPQEVYKTAFSHDGTQIATWMAPWLGWVYYLIFKHKIKTAEPCRCPACGQSIGKNTGFILPEKHITEQRIGALNFKPYRCINGHQYVVKENGEHFKDFVVCEKCGALASKVVDTKTVRKADYSHTGEKKETCICKYCGESFIKTVVIPKLVHSSSSSSGSSRSYSSSSSSRGSFGGGRSGGGGYSGRW